MRLPARSIILFEYVSFPIGTADGSYFIFLGSEEPAAVQGDVSVLPRGGHREGNTGTRVSGKMDGES